MLAVKVTAMAGNNAIPSIVFLYTKYEKKGRARADIRAELNSNLKEVQPYLSLKRASAPSGTKMIDP